MTKAKHRVNEDLIVGLDPGSTKVGLAVLWGSRVERLEVFSESNRLEPILRILRLADLVRGILDDFSDSIVLVENTSGKVGLRRHRGGGAGLAVYGMSIGAIMSTAVSSTASRWVFAVLENIWTQGKPKEQRLEMLRLAVPAYRTFADAGKDRGGDAGDALGLAYWFQGRACDRYSELNPVLRLKGPENEYRT